MKISRTFVTAACATIALLSFLLYIAHEQAKVDIETLNRALTRQIDEHSSQIASLLATMNHADTNSIQNAIYDELRAGMPTSLISRSDIKIQKGPNGLLECVVDTSRYGVTPRAIPTAPHI